MKRNNNSGITLVALIITIIVLLILAGISFNLLLGENGILEHASTSSEQYSVEAATEELRLDIVAVQTEIFKTEGRQATPEDFKNKLEYKYTIELITETIASEPAVAPKVIGAKISKSGSPYKFTIDEKLVITAVEVIGQVQITADMVEFEPDDSNWNVTTVKDALDYLYEN